MPTSGTVSHPGGSPSRHLSLTSFPRWTQLSSPTCTATISIGSPDVTSGATCRSSPPHTPHGDSRPDHGFAQAVGLRTWAAHTLVKNDSLLRITALPGQHAPGVVRPFLPPVMGAMLELRSPAGEVGDRIYVSGDTLFVSELGEIPRRFPHIPLALIHLGATTLPGGVMVTMDHRQGCDLLELLRPDQALPIHLDDYSVFKLNLDDLTDEIARRNLEHMVVRLRPGETLRLSSKAR